MERLRKIINELIEIREIHSCNFSDDSLLENATKIYNTEVISKNQTQKNKFNPYKEEPATEKQKFRVKKIRGIVPAGLTKQEAFKIIKEDEEKKNG